MHPLTPSATITDQRGLEGYWLDRVREHVADVAARSPWYAELLKRNAQTIRSMDDLRSLPFTTKDQLAQHNAQFLAIPKNRIVDHVFTSGSTGEPVPFVLSERDLQRLAMNEALSLSTAGITSDDVVQITTTLDKRFMAGLAYWLGLRQMGAGVVRSGPGHALGQWDTAVRCGTTTLIAVPSFLLRMLQEWHQAGLDPRSIGLRKVICIGEPISDGKGGPNLLAKRILELCDLQLHGTYASTEMATAFTEPTPFGGHLVPHVLAFVEVLGDDDRPVPEGSAGEVVATPFGVEAMPLLRYRTGDVCAWHGRHDADGRYGMMLGPVLGRKEQRMKVKGTTLYPQQVIDALNGEAAVQRFVVLREKDEYGSDAVRVLVDTDPSTLPHLTERLRDRLRVLPTVEVAERARIERLILDPHKRKPTLFIDQSPNN